MERGDDDKEEMKINPQSVIKPLHKIVADHKDVVKMAVQLNGIMSTLKSDVTSLLAQYNVYDELWADVSYMKDK